MILYQGEDQLGGSSVSLSELEGRAVILNFWATTCPAWIHEMLDLEQKLSLVHGPFTLQQGVPIIHLIGWDNVGHLGQSDS